MYSFNKIKAAAATLIVGFLLAIAFIPTAQADHGTAQGLTAQQWKAVRARAQATDRYYQLGAYSPAAVALGAEERRARATNRYYRVGSYAVIEGSSPFRWSDAGIGAGTTLGAVIVAGGLIVAMRRHTAAKTSLPSAT